VSEGIPEGKPRVNAQAGTVPQVLISGVGLPEGRPLGVLPGSPSVARGPSAATGSSLEQVTLPVAEPVGP
jgi:hypothetical protein